MRIAAEVKDFDPATVASPKEARKLDRNVLLALGAAREAVADAGARRDVRRRRASGSSSARRSAASTGSWSRPRCCASAARRACRRTSCRTCSSTRRAGSSRSRSATAGRTTRRCRRARPGRTRWARRAELIRRGDADAVLAGGAESCMHPLILAGFCAMRGLVAEEEDPASASRPFDATRAGFVMGEGACVLVLEELEAARARGATIYAEVLGYGASNDAHHMAQPDPESTGRRRDDAGGARARPASRRSGSGTSTRTAPRPRSATPRRRKAIKDVFGDARLRARGLVDQVDDRATASARPGRSRR